MLAGLFFLIASRCFATAFGPYLQNACARIDYSKNELPEQRPHLQRIDLARARYVL